MRFMRSRPSPAMIVAALALTIALGGTAIAAPEFATQAINKSKVKKIAKKQAKKQIKKLAPGLSVEHANTANTAETARPTGPASGDLAGNYPDPLIGDQKVTENKIADAAVTTNKIADDAVNAAKIAANAVGTSEIVDGAVTTGKIANGQVGGSDLGNVVVRTATDPDVPTGDNGIATASCLGSEVRLSGGAFWEAALNGNKGLQATFATGQKTWVGYGRNQSGVARDFFVQVLCLQG